MDTQKRFKTQTFNQNGQEYLYQIFLDGMNSIVKIYDSNAKLRSTQRMRLPANYTVYTCQNYLILLSSKQIQLYKIPNISSKTSCSNPGIRNITSCCYNIRSNLIFLIDNQNNLYYLMPQIGGISVKKIYSCIQNNIHNNISKVSADNKSYIYLLSQQINTVYMLKFDWNKNDKLTQQSKLQNIIDIYCKYDWKIYIQQIQTDQQNYRIIMNQNGDQYQNGITKYDKFDQTKLPIIKCNKDDFLFIDVGTKVIILINKKQHLYYDKYDGYLPRIRARARSDNCVMFQVKVYNYDTINLNLRYYTGLREVFENVTVPIKWVEKEEEDQVLMAVHNNVGLILGFKGMNPHFNRKVNKYLQTDPQNPIQDYSVLTKYFFQKLFKQRPDTLHKLAQYWITKAKHQYLAGQIKRYIQAYQYCLSQTIQTMNSALNYRYNSHDNYQNQQQQQQNFYAKKQFQQIPIKLNNMITFIGVLAHAIKLQQAVYLQRQISKNIRMNDKNQSTMKIQQTLNKQNMMYKKCLERCKSLYLLYLIVKKSVQERSQRYQNRMSQRGRGRGMKDQQDQNQNQQQNQNYNYNQDMRDMRDQNQFGYHGRRKVGQNTCHELFQNWDPDHKKINIKTVFNYLKDTSNFYYSAYFYIYFNPTKTTIPYIADQDTVQLIKFIVQNPMPKVLNNRQKHKNVLKQIPKITSKALLVNQQSFLQYLCGLSVNAQEYQCCLAILLSGVQDQWTKPTRHFIIECLILCDRSLLAYEKVTEYSQNQAQRRQLLENFVTFSLREQKVKDLFQLGNDEEDAKYIQNRLDLAYGDQAKEIFQLMYEMNKEQSA